MVVFKKLSIDLPVKASVLTIGSFDGMHLGHLEVLKKIKYIANSKNIPSVVVTFNPHPKIILSKENLGDRGLIVSVNKKLELLDVIGIDYVWLVPFNKEIAKMTAGVFLKNYIVKFFNPKDIVIGFNHYFGNNKEGDEHFLYNKRKMYEYKLHVVSPYYLNDMAVSSTLIRKYIKSYNLTLANKFLGRQYEVEGVVIRGNGVGTKINFPTANIKPLNENQLIPSNGVYCVDAIVEDKSFLGMCNIGCRPTFYNKGVNVIEIHILTSDYLNLLDKKIKIIFKGFLRKEKKHDSASELVEQLKHDKKVCIKNYLN